MKIFPRTFSFTRLGLPVIATLGLLFVIYSVVRGLPDRQPIEPENEPPKAIGEIANSPRVAGTGIVEPASEVIEIGTALSGLITAVQVKPGDLVTKGQTLFLVDSRAARAKLEEANAAVSEAYAAISEATVAQNLADQQLELYRAINDEAAVSRLEIIRAEGDKQAADARFETARARLMTAEAQQNSARVDLERLTVRAPIAGEILAVNVRPGEYVSTMGTNRLAFIKMGETSPLHVRIDIDEDEAARISEGSPAIVSPRGAADHRFQALFVRSEPTIVPKRSLTNSAAERVDVRVLQLIYALPPEAKGSLRVGQQVDAFIAADPAGVQ